MTWNPIATIAANQDWQFTPIIAPELGYVRLKFATSGVPVWIAQADTSDPNDVMFWVDTLRSEDTEILEQPKT